jgi:hypothetical protein
VLATLEDLAQSIENVRIDDFLSRMLPTELLTSLRTDAMYLSAAILDCLKVLIECTKRSRHFLVFRRADALSALKNVFDLDALKDERARVNDKLGRYTSKIASISSILQAKNHYESKELAILEWIWPENRSVVRPKERSEVENCFQLFMKSEAYTNWTSKGPSVLVCSGQRTSPVFELSDGKRARESPILCMGPFSTII